MLWDVKVDGFFVGEREMRIKASTLKKTEARVEERVIEKIAMNMLH